MNYSKRTLEFSMDNAAFEDNPQREAGRILRLVIERIESGEEFGTIKDMNENTVGKWDLWGET